jgi:hypothetical protein
LNRIQVEGGTGARRMELIPGGWNRIQEEGGIGTRRVEQDTHNGGTGTGRVWGCTRSTFCGIGSR